MDFKKILLIPLSFCLLTGCSGDGGCSCGGENTPLVVLDLEPGEKLDINDLASLKSVMTINLFVDYHRDSENSVTSILLNLSTSGYQELSYFIDTVTFTVSYDYLSDSGIYMKGTISIASNPSKIGNSNESKEVSCNYRAVKNVGISDASVSGYVVRI